MEIPDGIPADSETKEKIVYRLKKAIYGLRICPIIWNKRSEVLLGIGFERDVVHPCLFTRRQIGKVTIVNSLREQYYFCK